MDKELLEKFINNNCTPSEIDSIFDWIQKEPDKITTQVLLRSYWDRVKTSNIILDEQQHQQRLDRIHHLINLNQSEKLTIGKTRLFPSKKVSLIQIFSRVAVILLIPVITLLVYTRFFQPGTYNVQGEPQMNEIISPMGSRTSLELSDGTKVWLNHGSKMIYPQRFTGKTRIVRLFGEGYFKVAHNRSIPFIVEAGGMAVKAIGTNFNVKAYGDDTSFETSLESGKVIILKETPTNKELTVCEMEPGQHFIFNNTNNKYSLKTEDLIKYVSWKEGKLVFIDDTMDKVAERLSRRYNVDINLEGPGLKELTYTATFIDESLYQILEMLEIVTPISYSVSERDKLPDGTYTKRKISIYREEK